MNDLFASIVTAGTGLTLKSYLIALGASLICGLIVLFATAFKNRVTKSFAVTVLLLPAIVQTVIMMVNGNVGTGVAVAGAFSLVRFRSVPGTAKEICTLFLAMGAGLIAGMGYLGYAALFTLVMCVMFLLYSLTDFGEKKNAGLYKTMSIMIPEDLDYSGVFDGVLGEYTKQYELVKVKTTNMGSMFKLTYNVILRDINKEKEMIDALRIRNGNLEITVSNQSTTVSEL